MNGINGVWQIILALGVTYLVLIAISLLVGRVVNKWINDNIG